MGLRASFDEFGLAATLSIYNAVFSFGLMPLTFVLDIDPSTSFSCSENPSKLFKIAWPVGSLTKQSKGKTDSSITVTSSNPASSSESFIV
jgi:hypothetical protein